MPELSSGYAGGGLVTASSFNSADSLGSATVSTGGLNTKGGWVELIASTPHDANWIEIDITGVSAASQPNAFLMDIGLGSATEQVIIPDLVASFRGTSADFGSYLFPIFIPKGSRLSARAQSSQVSATSVGVSVRIIAGTLLGAGSCPSMVSGYGATASSLGTNIDPGGTANTWSAWTQITAATDRDHHWLVVAARFGDLGVSATSWRTQVGIGSATEQVLIPDMCQSADFTSDMSYSPIRMFPIFIPKGSRLTVRSRSSVSIDGDRDVWIRLYGAG